MIFKVIILLVCGFVVYSQVLIFAVIGQSKIILWTGVHSFIGLTIKTSYHGRNP